MKKFIKVFSYFFLVAIIISIALCYIIIPERTKLAFDVVVEYLNKPLPIAGVSIITLGLVVYVILEKTKLGRKILSTMKNEFDNFKKDYAEQKEQLIAKEKELEVNKREQLAYLSSYNERIDKLETFVIKVCETSPNAKIKALAQEIKENECELKDKLKVKLDEVKEVSDEEYKTLTQRLDELEKLVAKYGKEESNN